MIPLKNYVLSLSLEENKEVYGGSLDPITNPKVSSPVELFLLFVLRHSWCLFAWDLGVKLDQNT